MESWPEPRETTVVGIDLAWKEGNVTGVSVAHWTRRQARLRGPVRAGPMNNQELVNLVRGVAEDGPCVVAVDCPLEVPNRRGMRPCDLVVARLFRPYDAGPHPANRDIFTKRQQLRGERLARQIRDDLGFSLDPRKWHPRRVIEVYPHPATVVLFDLEKILPYKAKGNRPISRRREALAELQRHLARLSSANPRFVIDDPVLSVDTGTLRGRAFKDVEDRLDSLVCAYVGLVYALAGPGAAAIIGDQAHGHIVVPMTPVWWRRLGAPHSPGILYAGDRRPPNP